MSGKRALLALILLITLAYLTAWNMVYQQSKNYFNFAQQQYAQGDYILALKGLNKIELYAGDNYSGGYQQVIDDWRNGLFVYRPDFYYQSLERSQIILQKASIEELDTFIKTYTEIDTRYIAEAATCLLSRYQQAQNRDGEAEMIAFLAEAFPDYRWQASSYLANGCQSIDATQ